MYSTEGIFRVALREMHKVEPQAFHPPNGLIFCLTINMKNMSRILCLAAILSAGVALAQPIAPSISAPVESAFQRLLAAPP